MTNETEKQEEVSIKCSMTIANVKERRYLRYCVDRLLSLPEDSPLPDARIERTRCFGEIVNVVCAFCSGTVHGKDISNVDQLEDLEDDVVIQIADAVLGQLSEEAAKKSKESSPLSLRVVTG